MLACYLLIGVGVGLFSLLQENRNNDTHLGLASRFGRCACSPLRQAVTVSQSINQWRKDRAWVVFLEEV